MITLFGILFSIVNLVCGFLYVRGRALQRPVSVDLAWTWVPSGVLAGAFNALAGDWPLAVVGGLSTVAAIVAIVHSRIELWRAGR